MDAIEEYMWLGDRLPTIYELSLTIFHYSKKSMSTKRQEVIHKYAVSVRNIWIKSFTERYVMSLTAVKNRINNIMKDYENNLRTGNSSKNKGPTSQRKRNEIWMYKIVPKPKTKLG